ncbi:hypothetical protein [Mesorhizobium sp. RMAD-H1]|uniref:hypothetical protein n=1 Tax=Mesorhizobium sp. RMAD-H1 TaxID=2587065 RepID=UPI0016119E44|nr:hypothetical protein [Mesorhizobium sp. RMAD-H1]MBB2973982.1 hypothetical protein [Mesorhizobium sp. RMAD-H1]
MRRTISPSGPAPDLNPFMADLPPLPGAHTHGLMLAICLASNAAALLMLIRLAGA